FGCHRRASVEATNVSEPRSRYTNSALRSNVARGTLNPSADGPALDFAYRFRGGACSASQVSKFNREGTAIRCSLGEKHSDRLHLWLERRTSLMSTRVILRPAHAILMISTIRTDNFKSIAS